MSVRLSSDLKRFSRYNLLIYIGLSLHGRRGIGHRLKTLSLFQSNIPYTIQFLTDRLPDVNKIFIIGNKKHLCEKIEVEITKDGLYEVAEGTFYRIE